jgi:hypothetical protein
MNQEVHDAASGKEFEHCKEFSVAESEDYLQAYLDQDCQDRMTSQRSVELKLRRYYISKNGWFKKDDNGGIKAQLVNDVIAQGGKKNVKNKSKISKCCDTVRCVISRQYQENIGHHLIG